MAQTSLDQALAILEKLDLNELRQLEQAVRERLRQDEAAAEEAFLQTLLERGIVTEIRRPTEPPAWRHPPVPIQGKPLSETIIRERR